MSSLRGRARLCVAYIALLLFSAACVSVAETRQRELWRLPDGYRGWVYVQYANGACPELGTRGEYLVIDISVRGVVCTSTTLEGVTRDRFVYVATDGSERDIPPGDVHERVPQTMQLWLFVGSADEFGRVRASPPQTFGP